MTKTIKIFGITTAMVLSHLGTVFASEQVVVVPEESDYEVYEIKTYDTDDQESYDFNFDEKVTVDGKTYLLENVEYDVTEITTSKDDIPLELEKTVDFVEGKREDEYLTEAKEINENGYNYKPSSVIFSDEKTKVLEMESYFDTTPMIAPPELDTISSYNLYTYTDPVTKESTAYELSYRNSELQGEGIYSFDVNGAIVNYDAMTYEVGGVIINHNDEQLDIDPSKYTEILTHLGYDPNEFVIKEMGYIGEAYQDEQGVVFRDYYIIVETTGNIYRVYYEGVTDVIDYAININYVLTEESKEAYNQSGKVEYEVKATAYYFKEKVNETKAMTPIQKVVLATGIIIVLLLLAAFVVYLLRGGRKSTDYRSKSDIKKDFKEM